MRRWCCDVLEESVEVTVARFVFVADVDDFVAVDFDVACDDNNFFCSSSYFLTRNTKSGAVPPPPDERVKYSLNKKTNSDEE